MRMFWLQKQPLGDYSCHIVHVSLVCLSEVTPCFRTTKRQTNKTCVRNQRNSFRESLLVSETSLVRDYSCRLPGPSIVWKTWNFDTTSWHFWYKVSCFPAIWRTRYPESKNWHPITKVKPEAFKWEESHSFIVTDKTIEYLFGANSLLFTVN